MSGVISGFSRTHIVALMRGTGCKVHENGMNQKIEIERMEAAFKRAAEKATRGTREERSGRFEIPDDSRLTRDDTRAAKPRRGSNLKK
jgi:hypothetical protein